MHVELADLFRCPVAHADIPLVVSAMRTERRIVLDGLLGCPSCGAEYAIADGVIRFSDPAPSTFHAAALERGVDDGMRAAALLHATDASARLAFIGAPLSLAADVQEIVPARCLVINAPDHAAAASYFAVAAGPMAVALAHSALVIAAGALDGVYLARGEPSEWTSVLRTGGRLVAPPDHAIPPGFRELVRDGHHWVAERAIEALSAPPPLVQLRRR